MFLNEDESWQRHAKRGTPLADFECEHGWLPWEDCERCKRVEPPTYADGGSILSGMDAEKKHTP